jgi:hypothetical protein
MTEFSSPDGFCTEDEMYCAVPYGTSQYIIIHKGEQIRLCRTLNSAKNFINSQIRKK